MNAGSSTFMAQLAFAIAISFLTIVYISAPTLFFPTGIQGDLAADMLLGEALNRGEWLTTGHYSRFQFNHPGPFFFYWNLPFEWALEPFVGRLKAWLWGSVVLNAVLVGASAVALTRYFVKEGAVWLSGAAGLLMAALMQGDLGVVWLPTRVEAPFLAFLVALLWVSVRDLRALGYAIATLGMLVHGYVMMVLLAVPLLFVALVLAWRAPAPWPAPRRVRRSLLAAIATGCLFLLPILIELAKLPGGNFAAILAALDVTSQGPTAGLGEILRAVGGILAPQAIALGLCLLIIGIAYPTARICKTNAARLRLVAVLFVSAGATTILAYWGTPSPVPLHTMLHMRPLASLAAALAVIMCFLALDRRGMSYPNAGAFGLALGLSAVLILPEFLPGRVWAGTAPRNYPPQPWIDEAAAHMAASDKAIALEFADTAQWPDVAGILVWLTDRDIAACTTRRDMAFLFTTASVCPEDSAPEFTIVREADCNGRCSFAKGGLGVIPTGTP